MKKGFKDIEEYFLSVSQRKRVEKSKSSKVKIGELKDKISKLEKERDEYKREVESLKREIDELKELSAFQKATDERVELVTEIAILSTLSGLLSDKGKKVLLSRNFRKELSRLVTERPFIFESFLKSVTDSVSKIKGLKASEETRIAVESQFGNFAVVVVSIDEKTVKFEEILPEGRD